MKRFLTLAFCAALVSLTSSHVTAKERQVGDIVPFSEIRQDVETKYPDIESLKKDPDKLLGKIKKGSHHWARFPNEFNRVIHIQNQEGSDELIIDGPIRFFGNRDYFTIVLKESKNSKKESRFIVSKDMQTFRLKGSENFQVTIKSKYDEKGFYIILPENNIETIGVFELSPSPLSF